MTQRKLSDVDRHLQGLAGIHKLRALCNANGVQNKHVAIRCGVHISEVTRWFGCERNVVGAAEYVAERVGLSVEAVEELRKDQAPQPAEVA